MKLKLIVLGQILGAIWALGAEYKLSYSDTLMYLGTQSYKAQNYIHAREKLDSCILLNPQNDECKYYRAKIEFDMKSYERAAVMFKNVLALKEMDASSWHMLGLCFTQMRYYDSAEFCFKNAVRLNSKRSEFFANWANNQFLRGNLVHSEQLYSTAILLDDKNPLYYTNRAEVREKMGNRTKAEEDLRFALNLDPSNEKIKLRINNKYHGLPNIWLLLFFGSIGIGFVIFWIKYRKS